MANETSEFIRDLVVPFVIASCPMVLFLVLINIRPQTFRRLVFRLVLIFWIAVLAVGGLVGGNDRHPWQWPAAMFCCGMHWFLLGGAAAWLYEQNRPPEPPKDVNADRDSGTDERESS